MAQVKFTNSDVNDLTGIWDYIVETWSVQQAGKYYNMIMDACLEISKNPQLGKEYFEVYPDLKGLRISKHIIFYRLKEDDSIEISRILHEQMDLRKKLKK